MFAPLLLSLLVTVASPAELTLDVVSAAWDGPEAETTPDPLPVDPQLADLAARPDVAGFVGPIEMPDGTEVAVIARTGDAMASTGTIELAVGVDDTWHIEQVIATGNPATPIAAGDVDSDGRPEIVVTVIGSTGGKDRDALYRIDENGPSLREIPFAFDELVARGILPYGLTIDYVTADRVGTTIITCTPNCAADPGQHVGWQLDRTGDWVLRLLADPRVPGPIDLDSPLLSGFDQNWQQELEYGDPAQLAAEVQVLSDLTGWRWTADMVIALGASYCNNWPSENDEYGVGETSELGYESWALAIGPVIGVDADATRTALAAVREGTIGLHQRVCE